MVRSLLSLRKEMFNFLFFSPPLTYSAPSLSLSLLSRSQEHSICAALSNGQFFALGVGVIKVKLSTQRKALYQLRKQSASETLCLKPLFIRTVCASLLLHTFPLSLFCSSYLLLWKNLWKSVVPSKAILFSMLEIISSWSFLQGPSNMCGSLCCVSACAEERV